MVMGGVIMLSAVGAALYPRLRHLDVELPDMIADPDVRAAPAGSADPERVAPEPATPAVPSTAARVVA
jgi:hypothetical protein